MAANTPNNGQGYRKKQDRNAVLFGDVLYYCDYRQPVRRLFRSISLLPAPYLRLLPDLSGHPLVETHSFGMATHRTYNPATGRRTLPPLFLSFVLYSACRTITDGDQFTGELRVPKVSADPTKPMACYRHRYVHCASFMDAQSPFQKAFPHALSTHLLCVFTSLLVWSATIICI